MTGESITGGGVVHAGLASATLVFAAIGFLTGDTRFYLASGLTGTMWWLWDWVVDTVFAPISDFVFAALEGDLDLPLADDRMTADDTICLLESRFERAVSYEADYQVAMRLADLYRAVRKDPARVKWVFAVMRQRYPDVGNHWAPGGDPVPSPPSAPGP